MSTRRPTVLQIDLDAFVEYLQGNAHGRAHAKTAKAIRAALGFSDRECRAIAHEAARIGVLVCADNAGYFVPASFEEVQEAVIRLKSQAFEMSARARLLERLARATFAPADLGSTQPTLFGVLEENDGVVVAKEGVA